MIWLLIPIERLAFQFFHLYELFHLQKETNITLASYIRSFHFINHDEICDLKRTTLHNFLSQA